MTQPSTSVTERPEGLDALVPRYFAAVPADPYDGAPVRYDAERGIIYAVGPNLRDDGGSTAREQYPMDWRRSEDLVLPLGVTNTTNSAAPPASTSPSSR